MKHDLESLLEQIGFSSFLSRARIITFSPPRTRSKPPSLEAFYHFPGILTDFNSLPPASLSLVLLHFNCDFHGYLTRSRSTCIKCPSGINLLWNLGIYCSVYANVMNSARMQFLVGCYYGAESETSYNQKY